MDWAGELRTPEITIDSARLVQIGDSSYLAEHGICELFGIVDDEVFDRIVCYNGLKGIVRQLDDCDGSVQLARVILSLFGTFRD